MTLGSVLARPFPKVLCPLGRHWFHPKTTILWALYFFNSHLNCINLKTDWTVNIELSEQFVDSGNMQQVFGTENHYIQDEGRGHRFSLYPLTCKLW